MGLAVALVCASLIMIANGASRNLALAFGALVAAVVVFAIQAYFELQSTSATEDLFIEVLVDFQDKAVRSQQPNPFTAFNGLVESEASKIWAGSGPAPEQDQAVESLSIARDLALVSIISFLFGEQSDWQLNTATYKMISGEMRRWHGLSKPDEYTEYALADAKEKLVILGNRFPAALVGIQDKIRLPPHSTVEITANSVVLQNRVCRVTIELLEHFLSMTSFDPRDRPQKMVMLPNGKPRFQNVSIGVRVTTETSSLRAQARDLPKYQSWSKRLTDGLKVRFGNT